LAGSEVLENILTVLQSPGICYQLTCGSVQVCWFDSPVAMPERLWASCSPSHTCASVTKQCNLVPAQPLGRLRQCVEENSTDITEPCLHLLPARDLENGDEHCSHRSQTVRERCWPLVVFKLTNLKSVVTLWLLWSLL